jgi:hypothetical protein
MSLSNSRSRKQNRGRPHLTAEEWEEAEHDLEKADCEILQLFDDWIGRERPTDEQGYAFHASKEHHKISSAVGMILGISGVLAELRGHNPDNEDWDGWARLLLLCSADIIGPVESMKILNCLFGRAVLKEFFKKRWADTLVRREDGHRICIYIDAITWGTGASVRQASRELARMGLKERKDGAQGRVLVNLDSEETIRKRYMNVVSHMRQDIMGVNIYKRDLLRLKIMWHRAGEPPLLNWLKQLISQESGPDLVGSFRNRR